jgi:hypothetical protein
MLPNLNLSVPGAYHGSPARASSGLPLLCSQQQRSGLFSFLSSSCINATEPDHIAPTTF